MTQRQSQVIVGEGLLSIHELALICYTTVRTLQFYDRKGLLKPAHVDPSSKYRYYKPEQARDFFKIRLLQSFRVQLSNVPHALKKFDEQKFLQERLAIVHQEIEEKKKEYKLLKAIQEDLFGTKMEQHIKVKEMKPIHFVGMQVEIRYDAINSYMEKIIELVKGLNLPLNGDQITLYLDPLHYRPHGSLMEIGLVLKKIPKNVQLPENLFFKTLPRKKTLVYEYGGPLFYLTFVHKNMVDIAAKRKFTGLPYDIYKGPLPKPSAFDQLTVVGYPIE